MSFVISLVVVPADEFLEGFLELVGILVENQVEPLLGGTVDSLDLAAGLRVTTGRVDMLDADCLQVFIERTGDISAAVVA